MSSHRVKGTSFHVRSETVPVTPENCKRHVMRSTNYVVIGRVVRNLPAISTFPPVEVTNKQEESSGYL